MKSDYPELLKSEAEIGKAVADGQSTEQICDNLRRKGVRTTSERLSRFSTENDDMPTMSSGGRTPIPPSKQQLSADDEFPELVPSRQQMRRWMLQGMLPDAAWACIAGNLKINANRGRVHAYYQRLFDEFFPLGPIPPQFFEIKPPERTWSDDETIVYFGETINEDSWRISDVCQGLLILGAPGSGKTSGSGRAFSLEMLRAGFGGLILTTKTGEAANWINLCIAAGRIDDISVVRCDGPLRLNLLQYEAERPGLGAGMTSNLVAFFQNLFSVINAGQNNNQRENGDFWKNTGRDLLENLIETFVLAKEPLTLDGLCEFIVKAPMELGEVEGWRERPFFGSCLQNAEKEAVSFADRRMFEKVKEYWLHTFPDLAPDTRSCVVISFTSMASILRGRYIYDLISTRTTFTPEMIMGGRILIIDLPISEFHEGGLLVQAAWKYLLQRALLRRSDSGDKRRPVFMWEDEGHNFLIDHDNEFQAVSRESRVARVLISQNLNNFYAKFGGGEYAKTKVDALIANINTRIFHANGDLTTNKWASECIGTELKTINETTTTPTPFTGNNPIFKWLHEKTSKPTVSNSTKTTREARIQPHEFQGLQVGNSQNNWVTQAVVTQVGRPFVGPFDGYGVFCFQQFKIPEYQTPKDLCDEAEGRMSI
jgi:hypothetical protein